MDELQAFAERETVQRLQAERDAYKRDLRTATNERDELARRLEAQGRLASHDITPPKWMATRRKRSEHHATPTLLLTDTHFDEVVLPEQVEWLNAYNRRIAEKRLRKCVEQSVSLAREYLSGMTYDGFLLMLGGDIFSGIIHQELRESNEAPILRSVAHWEDQLAAAIDRLATEFGKLHIACTYGNHGRQSKKPVAKHRAWDNFEWLMYTHLAKHFQASKHITFQIPDAADCHVKSYNVRYLLTHGDQFRGGSGISGALAPLMLGSHRKTRRAAASGRPYDVMVLGHWHRHIWLPSQGLIVGGTLKGFDEYCVAPGTRILDGQLRWVPVETLREGDRLFAPTENLTPVPGANQRQRCWTTSTVTHAGKRETRRITLRMASGAVLTASAEHPWLYSPKRCRTGGVAANWTRADEIRPGGHLPRYLVPWDTDQSWSAGWLAGMLDGEGWFVWQRGAQMCGIAQNPGTTLDRLRAELSGRGFAWHESSATRNVQLVLRGGCTERLRLIGSVRARRLIEKFAAAVERDPGAVTCRAKDANWDEVVSVTEDVGTVITMSTSSHTYFAEGYAAHNSYVSNFDYEPANQAMWIATPEHGITFPMQVWCQDKRGEGW